MSQKQIDTVKAFLEAQGFIEGEHYEIGSGESGTDNLSITIELAQDPRPLPEELVPYDYTSVEELQRSIRKGSKYRSLSGARFYCALRDYENEVFRKLPAVVELESTLKDIKTAEAYQEYQDELKRHWTEFQKAPRIAELNRELEEDYS